MINSSQIMDLISAEPFRPFRVRLENGESFEIRNVEFVAVGLSAAMFFVEDDATGRIRQRDIALTEIAQIEAVWRSI